MSTTILPRSVPARAVLASLVAAAAVSGCATTPSPQELDQQAAAMIRAGFRDQGIAKVDRLDQDLGQQACSSDRPPAPEVAKRIEAEALASIPKPADGQYLGDWREGEKLAQSGRGMTWSDASADTKANGGNCYNCHQISKAEISFGTIGPSLYQYGKLRGVSDPAAPAAQPIVEYTWGKLWNSKAYAACSNMPRFGHKRILDQTQLRHIMALLLDPKSPVNQ
ncbi:sulfur oxidation c-type cytochrome SoxX [Piscinibacter sakaiensis]|uniref:Sulfur oxidation protein SoxX n=1 Tax=Piscinibacter sakaiensis TaxID=1547922 RepID=A0A0K8P7X1_PISS1|nr:sulfur oxidation c-type cytochrome SoxX [Piscinibacter sakaiensis]GAP38726.1 sulfur oxidation protein SoxX [Piscinibacter sakaiensis]